MVNFTDTSEKGFQHFITHYLVTEQHFIETAPPTLIVSSAFMLSNY